MTRLAFLGASLLAILSACGGGGANRQQLVVDLREAMERNVEAEADLARNNEICTQVKDEGALERMMRHEVEEAIGRGEQCGTREICSNYDFTDTDWYYDVGRLGGGTHGGPTLILGFDTAGRVVRHFCITRE
jgi:hypothetical protein